MPDGIERQQQRVGAVGAGDAVLDADIGGELALELGDLRPENVAAALDDAVDGGLQPVADPFALRAKIDELHAGLKAVDLTIYRRLIAELAWPRKQRGRLRMPRDAAHVTGIAALAAAAKARIAQVCPAVGRRLAAR